MNYWPWVIFGTFSTVVIAIILTLYLTMRQPIEYDSFYNGDHLYVKDNFLLIEKNSVDFETKYKFHLNSTLHQGSNTLSLTLSSLHNNQPIKNATIKARLTRPATNKQDILLKPLLFKNDNFVSKPFQLLAQGTWILEIFFEIDDLKAYRTIEFEFPVN